VKTVIIYIVTFIFVITGTLLAAENDDAVSFFKQKFAELRGEVERPHSPLTDTVVGHGHPRCGTPITAAYNMYKHLGGVLPDDIQEPRPTNLPESFGSSNFIVHYAVTGPDAVYEPAVDIIPGGGNGVPDFVDSVLIILEHVLVVITGPTDGGNLGFHLPPNDNGRGGDNRYDIYLLNLGSGFFGFTNPDPDSTEYQVASFMFLDNDYLGTAYQNSPLEAVKVTGAHEYFHADQFVSDANEFDFDDPNNPNSYKPWWLEASAVWVEDVVYDDINDYLGYLPFFYGYPWMGLGTFNYGSDARSFHPYASGVWPIYLAEKHGVSTIRQIWQRCENVIGYNALTAMDETLINRGTSLNKGFLDFAVWNYHTGSRSDPNLFYSEGESFPLIESTGGISQLMEDPVEIGGLPFQPEHLAANYFVINAGQSAGGVSVAFDGEDVSNASWHAAILGYRSVGSEWRDMFLAPESGAGSGEFRNWDYYESIVVIPTISGLDAIYRENGGFSYSGSVLYDPDLVGGDVSGTVFEISTVYPAPFVIDGESSNLRINYRLDGNYIDGKREFFIYDLSGRLVTRFDIPNPYKGAHTDAVWDGRNESGEYIASGIYIILMETGGKSSKPLKFAVLNKYK